MKKMLASCVTLIFCAGSPVFAQNRCLECLKAADEELKACLDNAISVEDKNSCEDKQEEHVKTCEKTECRVERENREKTIEAPAQGR
jgi:hypothetical protein